MSRRKTPRYSPELRERLVDLVREGRSPTALAREYPPSVWTIRTWVAQADREEGMRSDGFTRAERAEIRRLRKENRDLREEREILEKAAAWFAQAATRRSSPS